MAGNKTEQSIAIMVDQKELILNEIVAGESLHAICRRKGMVSRGTIYNWIHNDREFAAHYAYAAMLRRLTMVDKILDIADNIPEGTDGAELMRIRTQLDTYKWATGRVESTNAGMPTGLSLMPPVSKREQKVKLADQLQVALDKGMTLEQVVNGLRE